MKDELNLVEEELSQAGMSSEMSKKLVELDQHRITSDTAVPAEEFLMRMFGKPCFPRRDLTTITGAEKCGKTNFTSMVMAGAIGSQEVLALERVGEQPLRVLWYDTEQSMASTKQIMTDRIYPLAQGDQQELDCQLFVFNVRSCTYKERMDYLVAAIESYQPDLVIVDNVCDLVANINEAEESIQLIDQLMQLATQYNCNVTVVIHLNRSGDKRNLRGWLGTEIMHKAFEGFYCEQMERSDTLSVQQSMTRKYRISEVMYYDINEDGLPVLTSKPANYQPRDSQGHYTTNKPEAYQISNTQPGSFCQDYIIRHKANARQPWEWDLHKLFGDAMGSCALVGLEDLQNRVMALSGIKQPRYYDKVLKLAIDNRVVQTTMDRNGRVRVIAVVP